MRKLLALLVGAALVAAVAVPLFAHGPGWGRGHHMMGPWGSAPGYSWQYERGYGELTEEQRSRLEELDRKFYKETGDLRNKIWERSSELSTLLNSADTNPEKVRAVQSELSDLRTEMEQKRLTYELEARKIIPGPRSGRGYGRGYYGHHMGGLSGPGYACWR